MHGRSASNRSTDLMDWVFLLGVLFKVFDGMVELVVGLPLLFLNQERIARIGRWLTADELAEDPSNFLANLILHQSLKPHLHGTVIVSIYLVTHGLVKLLIVWGMMRGSSRSYPWAIGALTMLLVIQVVDMVIKFSPVVLLLTILDVVVLVLAVREWREGRSLEEVLRLRVPWLFRNRVA